MHKILKQNITTPFIIKPIIGNKGKQFQQKCQALILALLQEKVAWYFSHSDEIYLETLNQIPPSNFKWMNWNPVSPW